MATLMLFSLLMSARAQMEADEKYIAIYGIVQQAENLAGTGEPRQALARMTEALAQLQQFQKLFPSWNPGIITYRLDDLAKKIAGLKTQLAAASTPVPAVTATPGSSTAEAAKLAAEVEPLRAQLAAVQSENQTLQAKLKEALASQPAAIDADELARAQEQIRSLMKENDLLKASESLGKNGGPATNAISQLRQQLADAFKKYSEERARTEKLVHRAGFVAQRKRPVESPTGGAAIGGERRGGGEGARRQAEGCAHADCLAAIGGHRVIARKRRAREQGQAVVLRGGDLAGSEL